MTDKTNPFRSPSTAAHEAVLELVKAGKITSASQLNEAFTTLINHYRSEEKRILKEREKSE